MLQSTLPMLLSLTILTSSAAKIGIFTAPFSYGQMLFNLRLAEILTSGGHDVVVIHPIFDQKSINVVVNRSKIRELQIDVLPDPTNFENFTRLEHKLIYNEAEISSVLELSKAFKQMVVEACEVMLADNSFLDNIRAEKFDLAFYHDIDYCQLGIIHHLGIPKWITTITGPPYQSLLNSVGIPILPSIAPCILQDSTNQMSFWERFKSFGLDISFRLLNRIHIYNPETAILKSVFGENFPDVEELRNTAKMIFVNADSLIEYPLPVTPKIAFVGGIVANHTNKLKEPFSSFVSESKQVVVVSLGSVASNMPENWKKAFMEMFRRNPNIHFVWKYETEVGLPRNVLRASWIPQNDILALDKTVGFITNAGYNSIGEAVSSGTPCVLIPLIGDQRRNARLAEYRGFGKYLSKNFITTNNLNAALHEILQNDKYTKAAKQLQKIIREKPLKPEITALYWTNFVLESEIDLDLPPLNTIQLYCIDVIGVVLCIVLFVAFFLKTILRWYYWSCCEMAYKEKIKIQ